MKKCLSAILLLACFLSLVSCGSHQHEFVYSETASVAARCLRDGVEVKACSCGQTQETVLPALGHEMRQSRSSSPDCLSSGSVTYKCTRCSEMSIEQLEALGHRFEETSAEPSRARRCLNEGCLYCTWGEPTNEYKEVLTFTFSKQDEEAFDAKLEQIKATLEATDKYDPTLHAYTESGALAEGFAAISSEMDELYTLLLFAASQASLAEVAYYQDMKNTALADTNSYMMEYTTQAKAKFFSLTRPFYDSCYREFYFYGLTEEHINAYLAETDTVSNPAYTALVERNDAILAEYLAMSDPLTGDALPQLYAEFVQNNQKMAQMLGYENYLDYAYEVSNSRDYTPEEVVQITAYVKQYLSPALARLNSIRNSITSYTDEDVMAYNVMSQYSFFEYFAANELVNDYVDQLAFQSNPNKLISFSDELNKLMSCGNLFRGEYNSAYQTYLKFAQLSILYFGEGRDNSFTVVHEFGHYMNSVYNDQTMSELGGGQSDDLLEMHSQGNELLFLYYLKQHAQCSDTALSMIEITYLLNEMTKMVAAIAVDEFEQAIYLDTYEGLNAEQIMADGTITWDEYDLLYSSICIECGIPDLAYYWRYGMTIYAPCDYISYSVSFVSVLQLLETASTQGFDVAKEAYLKLITYTDENPRMTPSEVLEYAGLLSFKDEQLYVNLNRYFTTFY